jgi:transcriptional regulator with XRE-family HTH domain
MTTITKLKQARKQNNILLQDMAYLLDMDVSNLSKYERGAKSPTLPVQIGYHIVTKTPLRLILKKKINEVLESLSLKVTNLIAFLEEEVQTNKISQRLTAMNSILDNLSCLKDVSEEEDE